MHVDLSIIKEEIDIDDTTIKLEGEDNMPDETMDISCASSAVKILEEHADMVTVPLSDDKSEDELKFIASLSTLDAQQLFAESSQNQNGCPYECHICHLQLPTELEIKAHFVNHQMNRHFCRHGCGAWCGTLELVLEHEYRQHSQGIYTFCCRICDLRVDGADRLASHMKSHCYVNRYVCAICRLPFESQMGLNLHRKNTTQVCGQVDYIQKISTTPELVAAKASSPADALYDVKVKDEPLDADEIGPHPQNEAGLHMYIKDEPLDEDMPDLCDSIKTDSKMENPTKKMPVSSKGSIWASLPVELRNKLRLPALKPKQEIQTTHRPPFKFSKWNGPPTSNATSGGVQRSLFKVLPNGQKVNVTDMLKKVANSNTAMRGKPPISPNILKVLPNNCMVIKLPPNTKIVKLSNQPSAVATATSPQNVVQLPDSLTISKITPEGASSPNTTSPVDYKPLLPPRDRCYSLKNRPECQELITEFQNQIRSIEKTLPIPGTVLHARDKETNGLNAEPVVPVISTLAGEPSNVEVFLNPGAHTVMAELRKKYPNNRFFWICPICTRSYEQGSAFRRHLVQEHKLKSANFSELKVDLKSVRKPESSGTEFASLSDSVSEISKPATPTKEIPPLLKSAPTPAIEAVPSESEPKINTLKPPHIDDTKLSQFQCPTCLKIFTTQGGMRIHMSIHTGEMPYKCQYCEKRFRTPGQVRVHLRRHTGEKPFQCEICGLHFTHRETLISHLSRHIGMKRYKCYGCDKYFVVVSGLRAHRRLRPDTCGKVKFTARAHGPRVRVIKGQVVFEHQPIYNGYLRSEDPLDILKERGQIDSISSNQVENKPEAEAEGKAKAEGLD
ncbi:uncharacterized protein [Drosophila pseudoobscura]|uniref:C2H2-type domain-containing protein n=1 Tax=Drosophila pseudoobscura pseudoobscura TaxID=46245 RepID=A0A6I8UHV3_DROPS|nr:uncharacterized protein LOC4816109 [Drosophila pseudoobscura]